MHRETIGTAPMRLILAALLVLLVTGCAATHPVASDYDQYLRNNTGAKSFPSTGMTAVYRLDDSARNHRNEFRSALVGYAHLWVVELGPVLEKTLESEDVQQAFVSLTPAQNDVGSTPLITIGVEDFAFNDFSAKVALHIDVSQQGKSMLSKSYRATGVSQGGKMVFAGPFGMKNAVQQSTKAALDQILDQFLQDLRALK